MCTYYVLVIVLVQFSQSQLYRIILVGVPFLEHDLDSYVGERIQLTLAKTKNKKVQKLQNSGKFDQTHYSKSQIFVQKFNFDKVVNS